MTEKELIFFAQWHMRCTILRYASRESCILSTRLLAEVLRELGIPSMPLAVGAMAFNEAAFQRVVRKEDFVSEDGSGAEPFAHRCVHEGMPGEGQWYKGHVTLLARNRYLCDPSADQFANPPRNLLIHPLMLDLDEDMPEGRSLDGFLYDEESVTALLPAGGAVSYQAHQEDVSYRECMDWEDSIPGDRLFDRVLETTMDIVNLFKDGPMPDLPALPPSHGGKDADIKQWELNVAIELGYTREELEAKHQRELQREQERAMNAQKRGQEFHDAAQAAAEGN